WPPTKRRTPDQWGVLLLRGWSNALSLRQLTSDHAPGVERGVEVHVPACGVRNDRRDHSRVRVAIRAREGHSAPRERDVAGLERAVDLDGAVDADRALVDVTDVDSGGRRAAGDRDVELRACPGERDGRGAAAGRFGVGDRWVLIRGLELGLERVRGCRRRRRGRGWGWRR